MRLEPLAPTCRPTALAPLKAILPPVPFNALLANTPAPRPPATTAALPSAPPTLTPPIDPKLPRSRPPDPAERDEPPSSSPSTCTDDPGWRLAMPWLSEPPPAPPTEAVQRRGSASFEDLFGMLVRRAAWARGSDRRSATLRLEIGAGALQGCAIVIDADPCGLRVVLDAPPGIDMEDWKNRLCRRLASEGLAASFP